MTGRSLDEVLPLVEILGRERKTFEDIRVLKDWGWTIKASLGYQRLFGDDMNFVKQIIDTLGDPLDHDKIENLIANGNQTEACKLIRLHTGIGPDEAEQEVQTLLESQQVRLIALAKQGNKSQAIRQYQCMHGCSLLDAKHGLDKLISSPA